MVESGLSNVVQSDALENLIRSLSPIEVIRFDFAYNTPGLKDGVEVYTPSVGDVLLDAWFRVATAFNGTTPKADIGTFDGQAGLFGFQYRLPILSTADSSLGGFSVIDGNLYRSLSSSVVGGAANNAPDSSFAWQAIATDTLPLLLVVSQDGSQGGDAIGGTTGAGSLFLQIAHPTVVE